MKNKGNGPLQKQLNILRKVQKIFPHVTKVVDADESISIDVRPVDARTGKSKDGRNCALAKACVRTKIADHAIIGLSTSFLVKGDVAVRYVTSNVVQRELTSFDRHHDFAEGKAYKLSKVSPSNRIDTPRRPSKGPGAGTVTGTSVWKPVVHKAHTADIRRAQVS